MPRPESTQAFEQHDVPLHGLPTVRHAPRIAHRPSVWPAGMMHASLQQSASPLHRSPSVRQVVRNEQRPFEQTPEQHPPPDEQTSPSEAHAPPTVKHWPFGPLHWSLQHSLSVAHDTPITSHVPPVEHTPPEQNSEQQSEASSQVAPATAQVSASTQIFAPPICCSQRPVQHSAAAVHGSFTDEQRSMAPKAHLPDTHDPEQHSALLLQTWLKLLKPSSTWPLQLLSLLSQISGAPGYVEGLRSLQSVPPHMPVGEKESPSASSGDPMTGHVPVAASQVSVVQAFPSLHTIAVPDAQVPVLVHVSLPLHALPSLHEVPVAGVNTHPVAMLQLFVVQLLPSLHTSGAPAAQVPVAVQVSSPLHTLPSEQAWPSTPTFEHSAWQVPAETSESAVHELLSSQAVGHAPAMPVAIAESQVSPGSMTPLPHDAEQSVSVRLFAPAGQQPSPLLANVIGSLTQPPAAHMSIVHAMPSSQSSAIPALHVPAIVQVSKPLHALESEHDAPGVAMLVQPAVGSQASAVHAWLSLQFRAEPGMHEPRALHVSAPLQTLPSLHEAPVFGVWTQPVAGLQVSVVHSLLSSQDGATPFTHTPAEQNSAPSQRSESAHDGPLSGTTVQPVVGLQTSSVHEFPSSQVTGVVVQPTPTVQVSVVHALPSLQTSGVPGMQVPLQTSTPLHGSLSSHSAAVVQAAASIGASAIGASPIGASPIGASLEPSTVGPSIELSISGPSIELSISGGLSIELSNSGGESMPPSRFESVGASIAASIGVPLSSPQAVSHEMIRIERAGRRVARNRMDPQSTDSVGP